MAATTLTFRIGRTGQDDVAGLALVGGQLAGGGFNPGGGQVARDFGRIVFMGGHLVAAGIAVGQPVAQDVGGKWQGRGWQVEGARQRDGIAPAITR